MLVTMAIESPCPGCGVVLAVPDEHASKQARCPECSTLFVVPEKSEIGPPAPEIEPAELVKDTEAPPIDGTDPPLQAAPPEPEIPVAQASPPDHRQWWLKTPQGAVYGPISKDQLDTWCEEGRVADDCHVKHEEEHAWREAAEEYPVLRHEEPAAPAFATMQAAAQTPFGLQQAPAPSPAAPPRPSVVLPHRGVIIVALGLASWITVCCPVFGVIAWNMGNRDLELMYSGQMDASGMRMTHLGRLLGLIHVLTFVTLLILVLGFAVIYLVMQ